MMSITTEEIQQYVDAGLNNIVAEKLKWLEHQTLHTLLNVNPYFLLIGEPLTGEKFLKRQVQTHLVKLNKKLFGKLLKNLAIFIAVKTGRGYPSPLKGVDLEIVEQDIHYVVAIKPSRKWGNPSRRKKLGKAMSQAVSSITSAHNLHYHVESVLGIYVGNEPTEYKLTHREIVGQNFWYFISGNKDLYTEIVVLLEHKAQEYNEIFEEETEEMISQLTDDFERHFCQPEGQVDWPKLLYHTSANYDLDKLLT